MTLAPHFGMGERLIGQVPYPATAPSPVSPADRIKGRRTIVTCTACELRAGCRAPVPWSGPAPNPLLVVGEAPGATEDKEGAPFVGVSGQLLRKALREAGADPELLTFANTVCCMPSFKPPTPRLEHINACAPNLARTLRIVAPSHVLLVGAVALTRFRPDLRITSAHGRPFVVPSPSAPAARGGGLWCFPVIHPASILRDRSQEVGWRQDLSRWVEMISDPAPPSRHLPIDCAICSQTVERYDPDGIAWCATHYAKGNAGWEAASKKRAWMLRTEHLSGQALRWEG